ncbi:MAG TPA: TIGR02710 family CRISPR-associated CARF protein [Bryobacteraceae bacterium]|mgnify:FL=1|nr:TIGR02710 family CRISPR-associated CARF protein [Bryobacteraceae bacterium]HPU73306.1 TIGR02710 family CRISPR-associated CARF protein [Bryobacteraceae bacterium]
MPTLLICTVGGAPQPVVRSLLTDPRPEKVVFVCSADSEQSITTPRRPVQVRERRCVCGQMTHACFDPTGVLALAAERGFTLPEDAYSIVTVSDPQDLTACLRDMDDQLGPIVDDWLRRGPEHKIIADPTGGTKCMSAALGMVVRRWPCVLRYIGGESRTRDGLGVVEDTREKVFPCNNPLDELGYQAAEDAITLCSRMNFCAGAQLLEAAIQRVSFPEARAGLQALEAIMTFYCLWDRFAHRKALSALHRVRRYQESLGRHLSAESVAQIRASIPEWEARLGTLSSCQQATRELVEDLLANAARRRDEERYDDAVARLYRAIEAIAQCRLASAYGIRTNRVRADRVPEPLRSTWAATKPGSSDLKLGLQDAYALLNALGDELGKKFCSSSLGDRKHTPLSARNMSILAHGFTPISPDVCDRMWEEALGLAELIGIRREALFRFVPLQRRGG